MSHSERDALYSQSSGSVGLRQAHNGLGIISIDYTVVKSVHG